ncbi:hypothetical protein [Anaerostipes faecalis]|uniref:hypothetical protein n=1 Tax=Anaerostipes faecalis TaxID=2738446 RepID=UPI001C1DEFD9|nr:hypothetical protein [Anaerostipes faecalis]
MNKERRCADEKESDCGCSSGVTACCPYDPETEGGYVSGSKEVKRRRQVNPCGNEIM